MPDDLLPELREGDPFSVGHQNRLIRQAQRQTSGGNCYVDSTGTYVRAIPIVTLDAHWGTLDDQLNTSGSVAVSIYKGRPLMITAEKVTAYAPPLMAEATHLDQGTWVLVGKVDGEWYVLLAAC
jgi:hypothetical protein